MRNSENMKRAEIGEYFSEKLSASKKNVIILVLGIVLIIAGVYRLLVVKPTLPSHRMIEIGLLLSLLGASFTAKKSVFPPINEKIFISLALLIGFCFNAIWGLLSPIPLGHDTLFYIEITKWVSEDFSRTIQLSSFIEPLPPLIFAILYRLGLPLRFIFVVFVPLCVTLSSIPLYVLIKKKQGIEVAQIAVLFFIFSPYHLRVVLDLHRQAMAILFLTSFVYFAITEAKIPWKTCLCLVLLGLSHGLTLIVGLASVIIYAGLSKNKRVLINVFVSMLLLFLAILPIIAIIHWARKLNIVINWYLTEGLISLINSPENMKRFAYSFVEGVEWGIIPLIAGFSSFLEDFREKSWNVFLVLMGYLLLTMVSVIFCRWMWGLPDRWAIHLDIPTSYYAAKTVRRSIKQHFTLFSILLPLLLSSLSFGYIYLNPIRWPNRAPW